MDFTPLTSNLGGLGLLVLCAWIVWRQRNSDAAALLAGTLERIAKLEGKVDMLEKRERDHAAVLQIHQAWDSRVLSALAPEQAAALGPPPSLYPEG